MRINYIRAYYYYLNSEEKELPQRRDIGTKKKTKQWIQYNATMFVK